MYKATSLAKPVSRFGAVSSRLDGDERALKNAQRKAEKNERIARLINETVGEKNMHIERVGLAQIFNKFSS